MTTETKIINLSGDITKPDGWLRWYQDEEIEYINENSIKQKLENVDQDVFININTLGGEIFEAVLVFNYIKQWKNRTGKKATAFINGLVASAGVYILGAFDVVVSSDNSVLMTHEVQTTVSGTVADLEGAIDRLNSLEGVILKQYQAMTSKNEEEIKTTMVGDNFYFGEEIFNFGWSDKHDSELETINSTYSNKINSHVINKVNNQKGYSEARKLKNALKITHFSNKNNLPNAGNNDKIITELNQQKEGDNMPDIKDFKTYINQLSIEELKDLNRGLFDSIVNLGKDEAMGDVNGHLDWFNRGAPAGKIINNIKNRVSLDINVINGYYGDILANTKNQQLNNDMQAPAGQEDLGAMTVTNTSNINGFEALMNQAPNDKGE